jgi:hypothetical protein
MQTGVFAGLGSYGKKETSSMHYMLLVAIKKKTEVQQSDPDLGEDDSGFQAAGGLIAGAFVAGPNTESLAAFTGYPVDLVVDISRRMHVVGLWKDGAVETDH